MNQDKTVMHITHSIIAAQITLCHMEEIKHTPYYKRELKNKLNLAVKELIKFEPFYDEFFNAVEDSTSEVYDIFNSYIAAVASVPIYESQNITMIIEAYKKDPKSIEGIVKKILK